MMTESLRRGGRKGGRTDGGPVVESFDHVHEDAGEGLGAAKHGGGAV
jgi:hypothetical protein